MKERERESEHLLPTGFWVNGGRVHQSTHRECWCIDITRMVARDRSQPSHSSQADVQGSEWGRVLTAPAARVCYTGMPAWGVLACGGLTTRTRGPWSHRRVRPVQSAAWGEGHAPRWAAWPAGRA